MAKKVINILGVTGSVGQSAAKVIAAHPDQFEVGVITAYNNWELLKKTAEILQPRIIVIGNSDYRDDLVADLSYMDVEIHTGRAAILETVASPADVTLAAIVGMQGLEPLLAALPHSKALAIANKEPLVSAGHLVVDLARRHGTKLLPVDSEHNAIFQVFEEENRKAVDSLVLTASGGPFRTFSIEQMQNITPAQAVKHPNWSMGQKISVDSATMMNKALEVIEASILFDMPVEKIDVLVHPQSIIHSMVSYNDGSVLAQLGAPDMCTPIINALSWPDRLATPGEHLDLKTLSRLEFEEPDFERFPALKLGYDALKEGQAACLILNAANEVAVDAFLSGAISFLDVCAVCADVLGQIDRQKIETLEEILDFDKNVRQNAKSVILETYS
jgi:1-deoxy-D-xylulose-5-phosphate reductoisomerase